MSSSPSFHIRVTPPTTTPITSDRVEVGSEDREGLLKPSHVPDKKPSKYTGVFTDPHDTRELRAQKKFDQEDSKLREASRIYDTYEFQREYADKTIGKKTYWLFGKVRGEMRLDEQMKVEHGYTKKGLSLLNKIKDQKEKIDQLEKKRRGLMTAEVSRPDRFEDRTILEKTGTKIDEEKTKLQNLQLQLFSLLDTGGLFKSSS